MKQKRKLLKLCSKSEKLQFFLSKEKESQFLQNKYIKNSNFAS